MARPVKLEITDAMIELIPDDGTRISNQELRAAIEEKIGYGVSDEDFETAKESLNKQLFTGNIHLILAGETVVNSVWS
jgi:hypothetical protein